MKPSLIFDTISHWYFLQHWPIGAFTMCSYLSFPVLGISADDDRSSYIYKRRNCNLFDSGAV